MKRLRVMSYQLEEWKDIIDVRLERMVQSDGSELWAIREKGYCLNVNGEWEYEPLPSSRDQRFFKRCRFKTLEQAVSFWFNGNHHSAYEHYKTKEAQP